jgi:hypothetical protein
MPMPLGAIRRKTVAEVPVFYERRDTKDVWGDLAVDEETSGYLIPHFATELDESFRDLWKYIGKPAGIVTAGTWVDKPGAHGLARGFDLDGLIFANDVGLPEKWKMTLFTTPVEQKFYMGLMCHFSLSFGNVLGWYYNNAHKDHIHIDNLTAPVFRYNSHAVITTIQGAIKHIWNEDIHIDGEWGPATRMAMVRRVSFGAIYPTNAQYHQFLTTSRNEAFADLSKDEEKQPSEILPVELRLARIETFLKEAFANSPAFAPQLRKHGLS